MLIKGSLTLSKPCTAGSVALREQDGCQRVSGERSSHRIQLAAEMGGWLGATAHTGLCSFPPRPGLLAGSPGRGLSSERVLEPPSSLEGKFIIETKAMLGPSGAFPVPFPPELPAEVPQERAHTPQLGHTVGKHSRGGGGAYVFRASPRGTVLTESSLATVNVAGCSGVLPWQSGGGGGILPFPWEQKTPPPPRQGKPMVVLRVGSAPSIPDVTCVLSWCPAAKQTSELRHGLLPCRWAAGGCWSSQ